MKLRVILLLTGVVLSFQTDGSAQSRESAWKSVHSGAQPNLRRLTRKSRAESRDSEKANEHGTAVRTFSASVADSSRIQQVSVQNLEDAGDSDAVQGGAESAAVLPQPLPPVSAEASAAGTGSEGADSESTGNLTIFSDRNRTPKASSSQEKTQISTKQAPNHTPDGQDTPDEAHDRPKQPTLNAPHEKSIQKSFVIDGPIDRLGLADNLYLTGELVLALEMYRQIEADSESAEEIFWVRYQAACCLRRLDRIDEAQVAYRRLAESPEAGWLHELSLWWLDRINERIALEADLQKLKQFTRDLREQQNVDTSH